MPRLLLIALAGLWAAAAPARAAVLREASGLVQVRAAGEERWRPAGKPPRPLAAGDSVRTGFNARVVVALDGGAFLEASGNAQFALEALRGGTVVELLFGAAAVAGRGLGARPLELRSPTATVRARGDDVSWRVAVGGGGGTAVEALAGAVGVEGIRGTALLLRAGQRVEADLAGLHEPVEVPTPERARREDFAERMRRELALDLARGDAQRLVAGDLRRGEHELGRVLTDASGARVRAEEFVVRSAPNSFAFVALNSRKGAGLSYYSWSGVFDKALPTDLSGVFAILPGSAGAPAPWTLTAFTATTSNGRDSLVLSAAGGHQVDLNSNADPTDDVSSLFDPRTDALVPVSGPAYKVLFDRAGLYADGVLKRGWIGVNIQAQSDALPATTSDPLTGAALAPALPVYTANATFPDAGSVRQVVLESYSDGTSIATENRALSPRGTVMTRDLFGRASSGPSWQQQLLRQGFERTVSASEFGGRSVDVLVSPRALVETGALP